jgi:L-seryl-tRNA(Ser) seleniumtransferase
MIRHEPLQVYLYQLVHGRKRGIIAALLLAVLRFMSFVYGIGVDIKLGLYRAGRAVEAIPVWSMIAMPAASIRERAQAVAASFGGSPAADVVAVESTVGGGSLPGETLPSFAVALSVRSATRVLAALRHGSPAVVCRIADGRVILDLRTVDPDDDERLAGAIARALEAPA